MDKKEGIKYCLDIAEYDLETARAMLEAKRLLYVGFMCHQVIEKALKACYVSANNEIPPYTHNLIFLAEKAKLDDLFSEEQRNLIFTLRPLNVESRYPAYKDELFKTLSYEICRKMLSDTEEMLKWIKGKL